MDLIISKENVFAAIALNKARTIPGFVGFPEFPQNIIHTDKLVPCENKHFLKINVTVWIDHISGIDGQIRTIYLTYMICLHCRKVTLVEPSRPI